MPAYDPCVFLDDPLREYDALPFSCGYKSLWSIRAVSRACSTRQNAALRLGLFSRHIFRRASSCGSSKTFHQSPFGSESAGSALFQSDSSREKCSFISSSSAILKLGST